MDSWNLVGKTFVTGSWSNPSTAATHGTHVAVSSIEVTTSFSGTYQFVEYAIIRTANANTPLPSICLTAPV